MNPVTVAPVMTFASPQFVLQVLLILLAGLSVYMAASVLTKIADTPVGEKFINPQFVITVLLLGLVGFVLYMVFLSASPASNDVQVMVITAVVVTGLQEIRKFWLNSTADSESKNATIAQQARTAAVTTDALLDPGVVVSGTTPKSKAILDDAPKPPAPSGAPIQTENVTVNTLNTKVDEVDPKAP